MSYVTSNDEQKVEIVNIASLEGWTNVKYLDTK